MEKTFTPTGTQRLQKIGYGLFCLLVGLIGLTHHGFLIGIMGVIGGVSLLMPSTSKLTLDENGFSYGTLAGKKTARWEDIGSFVIVTYRTMGVIPVNRKVGWKFADSYKRPVAARVASKLIAFDGVLPDNYGMDAKELSALLEQWRLQATGQRTA